MEDKAPASLWIAALLLEGDDYERAVERALKLIETHDRVLAERGISPPPDRLKSGAMASRRLLAKSV